MINTNKISIVFLCLIILASPTQGSDTRINPELLAKPWEAKWIAHPTAAGREYGVFLFRHTFELEAQPESFIIHVSADNRYRLFVNGKPVGLGPARGDLMHWYFDTFDIASELKTGKNTLAAMVWNFGEQMPLAQISHRTAFILQGNSTAIANTNNNWKVTHSLPTHSRFLFNGKRLLCGLA
jgi:alpha-L-rhamnosidase